MRVPRNRLQRLTRLGGRKVLFVDTPKCGTSFAVEALVGKKRHDRTIFVRHPLFRGHLTWREYAERMPRLGLRMEDYLVIGAARNPWDWHVSWFHYVGGPDGGRKSGFPLEHELFSRMS
ncbi:MAG: hypothetical protein D6832_00365, partial [Alphaproteobacteria bacterium]